MEQLVSFCSFKIAEKELSIQHMEAIISSFNRHVLGLLEVGHCGRFPMKYKVAKILSSWNLQFITG